MLNIKEQNLKHGCLSLVVYWNFSEKGKYVLTKLQSWIKNSLIVIKNLAILTILTASNHSNIKYI